MNQLLGSLIIGFVIWGLFRLDRDDIKPSKAIIVPSIWLAITFTRPVSEWMSLSAPGGAGSEAYVDGSPLDRNILIMLLIVALSSAFKRRRQIKEILSRNPAIVFYFGFCLLSLFWCDYPFVSFKRWIRAIGDVVMVLLIVTEPKWQQVLQKILTKFAFVLVPVSILFIRCFPSLGRFYSRGGVQEWTGVGTDKNALGMICMVFGVTLLWRGMLIYRERGSGLRRRKLWALSATYAMLLYLLLVVDSKTALACFVMATLLIVVTAWSKTFRSPGLISAMMFSMVGVAFCVLFLGIGGGLLSSMGRDPSLTGRTQVWETVLPYAANIWVGSGYENFWVGERYMLFVHLLGGMNQAHNGYIEVYLNLGWIGILLLSGIILAGYLNILKGLKKHPDISRLKLAFFLIALVYNFTEASFKMMSPIWILFLLATMALPEPREARSGPEAVESPEPAFAVAAL